MAACATEPPGQEPADQKPLPPEQAAAGFRLPPGFHASVFAAEPDVQNPVAMAWDTRGRLWIAENYTYSDLTQRFDLSLRDRIVIFDDTDHDGRADKRTIFTDTVQRLTSVELGYGGAWLLCPPRLLFLPDRNGDDVPDGPAETVLDGFDVATENHHTFANGLRWGPDGWLYGRCGASSPGEVGPPESPTNARIPLRGGVWRYHPIRKRFEVLAHGTTNPWGLDWNALGEAFFVNTVNGHLWHLIAGAHFARPHSVEPNPRVYAIIDTHADHYHWDNSQHYKKFLVPGTIDDQRGGGHAHCGALFYLADQWPEAYRDKLLTLNFHGRRINVERLDRVESGFVGRHEPDIAFAADPWFRGIDLSAGPDGSVFVIDWSDTGECHDHDGVHRSSGRIFKLAFGKPQVPAVSDVASLSSSALVSLHRDPSEWFVRKARRVLAERFARGEPMNETQQSLRQLLETDPRPAVKLRALSSLFVIGGADLPLLRRMLDHHHESVRAWAIRTATDSLAIDTVYSRRVGPDTELAPELMTQFVALAATDPSALVRLNLASTLARLPVRSREPLARALVGRSEDSTDHNLPPLIWTALIPLADADPAALARLARDARIPLFVRLIARRLGEDIESRPGPLDALLDAAVDRSVEFQTQVVAGLGDALTGWHKARKPTGWDRLEQRISESPDVLLRDRSRGLSVLFGDGRALAEVTRVALDGNAPASVRKTALQTLIDSRPPDLRAVCEKLVRVRYVNVVAARGLALFDDPAAAAVLAESYRSFHPAERSVLLEILATRASYARALLDQVATGKIPRQEMTPFHVRQIQGLGVPALTERLIEVWGVLRNSGAEKSAQIGVLKRQLDKATLATADLGRGRSLFDRTCASCHKLYGEGGAIGPDLTGGGRSNLDYLLENLVDPSASVTSEFRMVRVAMADGRVLNGLIRSQTERTLTLQTQTEALTLDRRDIDVIQPSDQSLMPEGLLASLNAADTRDLIAYLMSPTQVPRAAAP
jgi:putative membrane-bound dehydrogenase-like protein